MTNSLLLQLSCPDSCCCYSWDVQLAAAARAGMTNSLLLQLSCPVSCSYSCIPFSCCCYSCHVQRAATAVMSTVQSAAATAVMSGYSYSCHVQLQLQLSYPASCCYSFHVFKNLYILYFLGLYELPVDRPQAQVYSIHPHRVDSHQVKSILSVFAGVRLGQVRVKPN